VWSRRMSRAKITFDKKSTEPIPISFLGWKSRRVQLWISRRPMDRSEFPPCIQNVLSDGPSDAEKGGGCNRAAAFLAAFLGQAGWPEQEALALWQGFAHTHNIKDPLFHRWFCRMHCPSCQTVKSTSSGYPRLGLGGLGLCRPDSRCAQVAWPVGYGCDHPSGQDDPRGEFGVMKCLDTLVFARLQDWRTGREMELEMNQGEREELDQMVRDQGRRSLLLGWKRVKGRVRPLFILGEAEETDSASARRSMLSEQI